MKKALLFVFFVSTAVWGAPKKNIGQKNIESKQQLFMKQKKEQKEQQKKNNEDKKNEKKLAALRKRFTNKAKKQKDNESLPNISEIKLSSNSSSDENFESSVKMMASSNDAFHDENSEPSVDMAKLRNNSYKSDENDSDNDDDRRTVASDKEERKEEITQSKESNQVDKMNFAMNDESYETPYYNAYTKCNVASDKENVKKRRQKKQIDKSPKQETSFFNNEFLEGITNWASIKSSLEALHNEEWISGTFEKHVLGYLSTKSDAVVYMKEFAYIINLVRNDSMKFRNRQKVDGYELEIMSESNYLQVDLGKSVKIKKAIKLRNDNNRMYFGKKRRIEWFGHNEEDGKPGFVPYDKVNH
jgi:hypothetical protein